MLSTATKLKRLREAADPPISVRGMAARLGVDHSTYVHYENAKRFKKQHLPVELARHIAGILADHGVEQDRVLELAGVGSDEPAVDLTPGQRRWLEIYDALSPTQRALIQHLAEEVLGQKPGDALHQPTADYRTPKAALR